MKKIVVTLLLFTSLIGYSQTNGITYQAVIMNPHGEQMPGVNNTNEPLVNKNICLKFSIIDHNSQLEYVETMQTTTDEYGMVNLIIGAGDRISGYAASFSNIVWNANAKSLKVEVSSTGVCSNYTEISNQAFTAIPFALFAASSGDPAAIGPPGPIGPQGPQGLPGTNGFNGQVGAVGPQGPQGLPGINGLNGLDGAVGPQGPQGLTGINGTNGRNGVAGAQGAQGIQGLPGTNGTDGLDGAVGPQGPIGLTGAIGPQGLPGANGTIGLDGATGPQGPIGLTGATGPQGPQGPQGLPGANGTDGLDGAVGPQGPIGLTGAAGAVGATGPQGPQGLPGANGTNGTIGLDGAVGPQGPQGLQGLPGANGTNGANGLDGAAGPQGPAGADGSLLADADASTKGKIQLAGDLGGSASAPTVPALATKVDKETGKSLLSDAEITRLASVINFDNSSNVTALATKVDKETGKSLLSDAEITRLASVINFDNSSNTTALATKVDKETGKSLLSDAEITRLASVINFDNSSNTTALATKVDKETGKSLLSDAEITRLASVINFDNSSNVTALATKVDKETGKSLLSNAEITRLASVINFDNSSNTTALATKVDKETGKSLLSDAEITRLASVINFDNSSNTTALATKVDKETGKSLLSDAEITRLASVINFDNSSNTTALATKVDKETGKSLLSDTEITRLASVINFDNSSNVTALATKVDKETGKSLLSDTEITRLASVINFDNSSNVTELALKAPLESPTFTGTVSGIDKTMVGLGNVDNTTDVLKPISTATQTALDVKENAANKSTDLIADATSTTKYPAVKTIKDYVDSSVTSGAPDATDLVKGKVQLAGDLTGGAASPTVAAGAITTAKLADNAVTSAKIVDATIIVADLADNAVETNKIKNANVTNAKLANSTVTINNETIALGGSASINASPVGTFLEPSNIWVGDDDEKAQAVVMEGDVTINSTGVTTIGDLKITNNKIDDNAVTTSKILNSNVTNAKLANSKITINGTEVALGGTATITAAPNGTTLGSAKIWVGDFENKARGVDLTGDLTFSNTGVTTIGSSAVTSGKIAAGAVTETKIGSNAVTETKIGSAAVTEAKIAANAITTNKIADGAVSNTKLKFSTITINNETIALGEAGTISTSPVGTLLQTARIWVGNDDNEANPVDIAGDVVINSQGHTTIGLETVTTGKIAPGAVTYNKIQNLSATDKVLGRVSAGAGLVEEIATTGSGNVVRANAPTFTGTVSGITASMVGLSNVDNTSDANKPVSTAQQTALDLKANLASPTFTGTVSGIDKTMVGLGSVNNTSDADKPVSTAQQTALNLKENAANKSTDLIADAASTTKYPSVKIIKDYVDSSVTSGAPDATDIVKGKVQLAGDLTGSAALPTVAAGAITTAKLATDAVETIKIKDGNVTDAKIATVSGSKVTGNISGNAATVTNGVYTTDKLNVLAATTSTELAGVISDETGTGSVVLSNAPTFTGTVSGITATMVGLSNVDNTTDADKPISTATATALADKVDKVTGERLINATEITKLANQSGTNTGDQDLSSLATNTNLALKANIASPTFTGTVSGITATMVGLANVDNTTDADKPISTATANALADKVDKVSGERLINAAEITKLANQSGTNTGDQDLSSLATNTNLDLKANIASPTFTGTVSGITATMVGLANVDNTTDADKPISTATANALADKVDKVSGERLINAAEITKLANQSGTNTGDQDLSSLATNTNLDLKANIASPTFTGTVSGIDKTMVGLGNVNNTSDADKPISTATATALANKVDKVTGERLINAAEITKLANQSGTNTGDQDLSSLATNTNLALKANIASPTFTGTVSGIDKTMVGLGNVNNTSDADKPISTATATALANKVDKVTGERLINAAEITKLANQSGTNTGDQDLSSLATNTNLALKANIASPTFTGTPVLGAATATSINGNIFTTGSSTYTGSENATYTFPSSTKTIAANDGSNLTISGQAIGDILVASTATDYGKLADVVAGNALISGGVGVAPSYGKIGLTTHVTGTLPIANGGTGSTSQNFVDLTLDQTIGGTKTFSNTIKAGTVTYPNAHNSTAGQVLTTDAAGVAAWATPSSGGVSTVGSISGTSTASGATITGSTLNLTPADATNGGVVTTGAQTFAGAKTFSSDMRVSSMTVGKGNSSLSQNTALGFQNLGSITTGNANTAIGFTSLVFNQTGANNTGVGHKALEKNVNNNNTGVGIFALGENTDGNNNTGLGYIAGRNTTTGTYNTSIGSDAMLGNIEGSRNTALGYNANVGASNLTNATAIGNGAIVTASNTIQLGNSSVTNVITSGDILANGITIGKGKADTNAIRDKNTAVGTNSLGINTTGFSNTAVGTNALASNTTGSENAAVGWGALKSNQSGGNNLAFGQNSLGGNVSGSNNTALGSAALEGNTAGENTAVGSSALSKNQGGIGNTAIGAYAMSTLPTNYTSGNYNTAIGFKASITSGITNATAIGNEATATASHMIQLGNTSVTNVKTSGTLTAGTITYPNVHGTSGQVLTTSGISGGAATWQTLSGVITTGTQTFSGDKTFSNTVTASSFIRTGGNEYQALMANGTTSTTRHFVGESYGGGIVFYVYDNGLHGLIAATSDQANSVVYGSSETARVYGNGIGGGRNNTAVLAAKYGSGFDNAASKCIEYSVNGSDGVTYADWYLPSRNELLLLYNQRTLPGLNMTANVWYWSSTEQSNTNAFTVKFETGYIHSQTLKNALTYVRAIRHF